MYGTGKIGFWSLMEEGIGIIAGSLPALRPLLSLHITYKSSVNSPGGGMSGSDPLDKNSRQRKHTRGRSGVAMLDTLQSLADVESGETVHDDGNSQKNIVKETRYTVTSHRVAVSEEERIRSQVLGWEQAFRT